MSSVTAPAVIPSLNSSSTTSTTLYRPPKTMVHYVFSTDIPIADPYTAPPQEVLSADAILVKQIIDDQQLKQTKFLGEYLAPNTNEHNLYISNSSGTETYLYVSYLGVAPVRPEKMYGLTLSKNTYSYQFVSPFLDSDWPITNGADVVRKIGNELYYETDARSPVPVPLDVLMKRLHFGKRILLPADLVFEAAILNTNMSTQFALDKAKENILIATGGIPLTTVEQATTIIKTSPISVPAAVGQPMVTSEVTLPGATSQTTAPISNQGTSTPASTVITTPTQLPGPVIITESTVITGGGSLIVAPVVITPPIDTGTTVDSPQLSRLANRLVFNGFNETEMYSGTISVSQNGRLLSTLTVKDGHWFGEIPIAFISEGELSISFKGEYGFQKDYNLPVPSVAKIKPYTDALVNDSNFNARLGLYGLELPYDTLAYRRLAWDMMDHMFEKGIPFGSWESLATVPCGKLEMINKYYEKADDYEYYDRGMRLRGPAMRLPVEKAVVFANADISSRSLGAVDSPAALSEINRESLLPPVTAADIRYEAGTVIIKKPRWSSIQVNGQTLPAMFALAEARISVDQMSGNDLNITLSRISNVVTASSFTQPLINIAFPSLLPSLPSSQVSAELLSALYTKTLTINPPLRNDELVQIISGYNQAATQADKTKFLDDYLLNRAAAIVASQPVTVTDITAGPIGITAKSSTYKSALEPSIEFTIRVNDVVASGTKYPANIAIFRKEGAVYTQVRDFSQHELRFGGFTNDNTLLWNGFDYAGNMLADGNYVLRVVRNNKTYETPFAIDSSIGDGSGFRKKKIAAEKGANNSRIRWFIDGETTHKVTANSLGTNSRNFTLLKPQSVRVSTKISDGSGYNESARWYIYNKQSNAVVFDSTTTESMEQINLPVGNYSIVADNSKAPTLGLTAMIEYSAPFIKKESLTQDDQRTMITTDTNGEVFSETMIPDLITKQKQNRWVTQNNSLYGNMYFFNNFRIAAKLNDSSISEVSWSIAEIGPSGGTVCPGTSDKESDYIDGDWFILDDIPACGGTKPTETGMVAL